MSFTETRTWLERICGPAGEAANNDFERPNPALTMQAFEVRLDFLNLQAKTAVDAVKGDIKAVLKDVSIKGRIDSGHALVCDQAVNVELLASLKKDGSVPIGVEQGEWDSFADAAATLEFIVIDGEKHEMASDEAAAYLREMGAKLAPLYRLSREMAEMTGPEIGEDGRPERLFSDRDIEKELWSPLVREGIIPSNLVPDRFSETVNVFRNGAAVYTELMAQEDGTEMGGAKGFDKFLTVAKDVVSIGKVIGGEILRYDNLEIVEASREDIAGFISNKTKISVDSQALGDLGVVPGDYPEGTELSPLQVTRAKFDQQMLAGGETNFAAWLEDQETLLEGGPVEGLAAEEQAAQLDAIKNAQLTEAFGEYTRKQAVLTCASAIAGTTLEAAQRARDRKRARRDVGEAVAEGIIDVFGATFTATDTATNLTQNDVSKTNEFKIKYACLATKAGIRGINKLSQAAVPSDRVEQTDRRELVVGALSDILDGFGEAFTATGEIGDGTDTRFEQAETGLIIKGVAIGVEAADKLVEAAQKRDFGAMIAIIAAAGVTIPSTMFAGDIGDLTRRDVPLDQIEAGMGADGSGPLIADAFIEVEGAAGQTGFGMSGDMATLADQRAVVVEAVELLGQIGAESYADAKGDVKKKFERIQKMARANPELASEREVAAFLNPDPSEPLTKEAIEAALKRIMGALDTTPIDGEAEGAAKDARIIAALDRVEDPDKLKDDVDTLRDMLTHVGATDGTAPDDAQVFAKFKEVRDNMLTDERVMARIQSEMQADEAWLEQLKAEADLTRLDSFTDPELRERERQKAVSAIMQLTAELKKTEMKLNILDQATKGAVGIVLAAVPGAALLGKIRDLVADIAKLSRRASELRMWQRQMENMRGNYNVYEYTVVGEKEVTAFGVGHDSAAVAADVAGVAAEALRLADHTHITAAVLTTIEKMTKALNEFWFSRWGESRIKEGWRLFKQARQNPENRRLAREAIRENTTLGKCVLAYGACIDKDSQAQSAVRACGLTPEVFEDSSDVCQAVVQYLRARLHDSEAETIASHDADANWVPCRLELKLTSWTMIKATACTLDPAMSQDSFATPPVDSALTAFEAFASAPDPDLDGWLDCASGLHAALASFRPRKEDGKLHAEMNILTREMLGIAQNERERLKNEIRKKAGEDQVAM